MEIIEEKVFNLCAANRILLIRRDGTLSLLHDKNLDEFRYHDQITYRYVGCEHGVGIYNEVEK